MRELELLDLCKDTGGVFKKFAPYWTSEIYGFGKHIREYASYPWWLPICVNTDHGVTNRDFPIKSELESDAPYQLFHSPYLVKRWKTLSRKPCFCLFSPYVFYRRKNNICQISSPKGTISFPGHSTDSIDDLLSPKKYINQLKQLPDQYHPISICLHYHDINKGLHRIYLDEGFEVFTAGNPSHPKFTERFYDILKNFKYSTSNWIGSYIYYSVEMGIPFFLHGSPPEYFNKDDGNLEKGFVNSFHKQKYIKDCLELFSVKEDFISKDQASHVHKILGLSDGLSSLQLKKILYFALLRWVISIRLLMYVLNIFRKIIKQFKVSI